MGRAGIGPPRSGSVANSTKFTLMMPSVALIGAGNGSFGACAKTQPPIRMAAAKIRMKVITRYYCFEAARIYLTLRRTRHRLAYGGILWMLELPLSVVCFAVTAFVVRLKPTTSYFRLTRAPESFRRCRAPRQ